MSHWRKYHDERFIGSWDIPEGKEAVVTIARIEGEELHNPTAHTKSKKPVAYFEGKDKGMVLNKTNCKTIAKLYGDDVDGWIGKKIVIYVTQTSTSDGMVDCLRVRPREPK